MLPKSKVDLYAAIPSARSLRCSSGRASGKRDHFDPVASGAVGTGGDTEVVRVGEGRLHHGVEAPIAYMGLDRGLPAGGVRANEGPGGADVSSQETLVARVRRLVQVLVFTTSSSTKDRSSSVLPNMSGKTRPPRLPCSST
ncbi:hypothetical protein GCM10010339_69210 [Streptomyces alanosinicus]|uniref:Uncharacterized protein n=1 Tax=Streptomyces alanosinicus TaxID=68171 RepID=A0A918YNX9_9ACTN|nr:hypothetical protein GCM10010339_69210 [Streptomyces alanosinicus]